MDQLKAMTMDLYFDYLGILLNGPEADGKFIVLNWNITDTRWKNTCFPSKTQRSLTWGRTRQSSSADATVKMTRATLDDINTGELTWQDAISSGKLKIHGDPSKLFELLGLLEGFELMFNIVTP